MVCDNRAASSTDNHAASTAADVATKSNATATTTVSSKSADVRGKSPIVSTANKVNAKTAAKNEMVVAVKMKEFRIGKGVQVFSTKSQLISLVKKGDAQHNIIDTTGNGFRFYGQVKEADSWKG